MKPPYKKRPREFEITPRGPGLDFQSSDSEKVERAMSDLIHLLSDPYYHEAYVRMRKDKHPALSLRRGRPLPIGELAAIFQRPLELHELGKSSDPALLDIAKILFEWEKSNSLTADRLARCRYLMKRYCPDSEPTILERAAKWLATKIGNLWGQHRRMAKRSA